MLNITKTIFYFYKKNASCWYWNVYNVLNNTILFYLETKTYTLLLNSYLKKKKKKNIYSKNNRTCYAKSTLNPYSKKNPDWTQLILLFLIINQQKILLQTKEKKHSYATLIFTPNIHLAGEKTKQKWFFFFFFGGM